MTYCTYVRGSCTVDPRLSDLCREADIDVINRFAQAQRPRGRIDNVGEMAEENTDKINSAASKKRKRHVLTRLHVSVLFTYPTPVSLCLAQRG